MKRKPKIVLPAKYILLILTVVCVAAMITSFTLNISGRSAQRGCRLCVCSHAARDQHGRRMDYGESRQS